MASGGPVFSSLQLEHWRQFERIDLDFHPRVTILTGPNASGKTTVLALLAKHFDWPRPWVDIPIRRGDGTFAFFARSVESLPKSQRSTIGRLTYGDGARSDVAVPAPNAGENVATYEVAFTAQQRVPGLYLTSHRAVSSYTSVESIPAHFNPPSDLFRAYTKELRLAFQSAGVRRKSPFAHLKESLIAAAVYGEGSESVEADPIARRVWIGFQEVLRKILPSTLGFERLVVRAPEVVVATATGAFPLDEASGGLSSLVELGWQIFLRSQDQERFLVLFDEPENHLHPELQRQVLPSLLDAFPHVQFVIASHSPFVVTSVPDSNVYVLGYEGNRRVSSRLLDQTNKAASADETLRDVLGMASTMPMWADARFAEILEPYLRDGVTTERMRGLRRELDANGLGSMFPEALLVATEPRSTEGDEG